MASPSVRISSLPSSSLPPSPSSSASNRPTPQYLLPSTQAYPYHAYSEGALHLLPCTIDQYFELPHGNEHKYELVDAIVWCQSQMGTHSHDEVRDRVAAEISRQYGDKGYEVVTERTLETAKSSSSQGISSRLRSSSSSSSRHRFYTIRRPDIAVFQPGHAPDRDTLSPQSKKITFPREYPPLLAIEITSSSTRDVDLSSKWEEYEGAEVQCYVIVDRADEKNPSVIVGMLKGGIFRKTVYRGNEIVQGLLFNGMEFSAEYLIDPPRSITEIIDSPVKKFKNALKDKDRSLKDKDRTISGLGRTVSDQSRALKDRDRTISGKDRSLRYKDRTISGLGRTVSDQSRALKDRDRTISGLDRTVSDQSRALKDRDRTISGLDRTVSDLRRQLAAQAEQKKSSWKSHGSAGKQSVEKQWTGSSGAGSSSSKEHTTPKEHSPSKPPKSKKAKAKK